MPNDLIWGLVRGHNHSMVKQRVCGDKFILSREATNMNNTHTPRFSGYANKKSAGVAPNAGGKGLVFTFASDETNKPNKAFVSVPLTSGIRYARAEVESLIACQQMARFAVLGWV